MKKLIYSGSFILLLMLYMSVVNGSLDNTDNKLDQEIDLLIMSADEKILDVDDQTTNNDLLNTDFNRSLFNNE